MNRAREKGPVDIHNDKDSVLVGSTDELLQVLQASVGRVELERILGGGFV